MGHPWSRCITLVGGAFKAIPQWTCVAVCAALSLHAFPVEALYEPEEPPNEEMELYSHMYPGSFTTDEVGKVKLSPNAYVKARDKRGRTLLHIAAFDAGPGYFMSAQRVQALLDGGAEINARDKSGRTPLMVAALMSNGLGSFVLLRNGADASLQDRDGWTALMYACGVGDWFCTKARRDIPSFSSESPDEKPGVDNYLTGMMLFVLPAATSEVETLIAEKAPLDAQTKDGWTALMIAATAGWIGPGRVAPAPVTIVAEDIEGIRRTLEEAKTRGREPEEKQRHLYIGGAYAVYKVEMLLKAGADRSIKNSAGQTALDLARMRGDLVGKKLVELLESPSVEGEKRPSVKMPPKK